jgi:Uma2 family endonuclease
MTAQDTPDTRIRHRLTVEDFLLLDREGAFGDRRTELFDGEVFYMSPKHRPHARTMGELYFRMRQALDGHPSGLSVLQDVSVRASNHDVPEPDIVLTDAPDGDGIAPLESVRLIVEVADSTLSTDLGLKAGLYARVGIPEYWVADVKGQVVYQFSVPQADAYAERRVVPFNEPIEATTIEKLTINLFD